MKLLTIVLAAAVLLAADTAPVLLEAAKKKEVVDGDLKGAIKQYGEIALRFAKTDRAVAASALVRMAECHSKLGDTEAQQIYQRVVREFGDQKDAVTTARARLAAQSATGGGLTALRMMVSENIDELSAVSADGRFISYADWSTGNLAVRDLTSDTDRAITGKRTWNDSPDWASQSAISRDGKQVAYAWHSSRKTSLRVAALAGAPDSRVVFEGEEIDSVLPYDWSPDGKWIAVQLSRKDRIQQIGLVSPRNGELRLIKSLEWRGSTTLRISRDGRYLAYDLPSESDPRNRDVFIVAMDGSKGTAVVIHPSDDRVLGWSADGERLVFSSDRSGVRGAWAIRVGPSSAKEEPILLKSGIGAESLGITNSGALFYLASAGTRDILMAAVDVGKSGSPGPVSRAVSSNLGKNNWPSWSPDGKIFAYFTQRDPNGRNPILHLRSAGAETGRDFDLNVDYPYFPRWLPDSSALAFRAISPNGQSGIYRFDVTSGQVTLVPNGKGNLILAGWAPDGQRFYATRRGETGSEFVLVERELSSSAERVLLRRKEYFGGSVSPDGSMVATGDRDRATGAWSIRLLPLDGGPERELTRLENVAAVNVIEWTPDSRAVIFNFALALKTPQKEPQLWRIPIDGGQAQRFKLKGQRSGKCLASEHPSKRRADYVRGRRKEE